MCFTCLCSTSFWTIFSVAAPKPTTLYGLYENVMQMLLMVPPVFVVSLWRYYQPMSSNKIDFPSATIPSLHYSPKALYKIHQKLIENKLLPRSMAAFPSSTADSRARDDKKLTILLFFQSFSHQRRYFLFLNFLTEAASPTREREKVQEIKFYWSQSYLKRDERKHKIISSSSSQRFRFENRKNVRANNATIQICFIQIYRFPRVESFSRINISIFIRIKRHQKRFLNY